MAVRKEGQERRQSMAFGGERSKHDRSEQTVGYVSRFAQRRVDERVMEIMSRRDAAVRRDSPSDQALSARRFSRRPVRSSS
jgi:hypothetical protein